jgi:hypothetical protein
MSTKNEYMLLFSSNEWYNELSQSDLQAVIQQAKSWLDGIVAQGKAKGGHALARQGATLSGKKTRVISDGPYAESKEAVGGYFILEADSLEKAIAIAKTNPALAHGTTIEIRPIAEECPLNIRARQMVCDGQMAA